MSIDIEQIANNILVSRKRRPARFGFFRTLTVGETHTVACDPDDRHELQTRLCMAKWWYQKRLPAKFVTRRVAEGVRVERVE